MDPFHISLPHLSALTTPAVPSAWQSLLSEFCLTYSCSSFRLQGTLLVSLLLAVWPWASYLCFNSLSLVPRKISCDRHLAQCLAHRKWWTNHHCCYRYYLTVISIITLSTINNQIFICRKNRNTSLDLTLILNTFCAISNPPPGTAFLEGKKNECLQSKYYFNYYYFCDVIWQMKKLRHREEDK